MDIIATYPSVIRSTLSNSEIKEIDNPAFLLEANYITKIEEPMVKSFVSPNETLAI